jgi:hypothetical protein
MSYYLSTVIELKQMPLFMERDLNDNPRDIDELPIFFLISMFEKNIIGVKTLDAKVRMQPNRTNMDVSRKILYGKIRR